MKKSVFMGMLLPAAMLMISCGQTAQNNDEATDSTEVAAAEADTTYDDVDVIPEFQGDFAEWLGSNIKYPEIAQQEKAEARVIITFVVDAEGNVAEAEVIKVDASEGASDEALQAMADEALRVINEMPAWKPGEVNGKPVRTRYTQPIVFRLN